MKSNHVVLPIGLISVFALVGCSSARDVEVTGEVKSASAIQGTLAMEVFDLVDEDGEEVAESVSKLELASLGAFEATVALEGETVRVRVVDDLDGDGACSEGEAWGEIDAPVADDDTASGIVIELAREACPAAAE